MPALKRTLANASEIVKKDMPISIDIVQIGRLNRTLKELPKEVRRLNKIKSLKEKEQRKQRAYETKEKRFRKKLNTQHAKKFSILLKTCEKYHRNDDDMSFGQMLRMTVLDQFHKDFTKQLKTEAKRQKKVRKQNKKKKAKK